MKSDVRAAVNADGVMRLTYSDPTMRDGLGVMVISLTAMRAMGITWRTASRAFADFAEGDRKEIKRLLDMLVFKAGGNKEEKR